MTASVGLMYVSDYYFSYASSGTDSKNTNCYSDTSCKNSWLHISNNGVNAVYDQEWTMVRSGLPISERYSVWRVRNAGDMHYHGSNNFNTVRPVFYLDTSIEIKDGTTGTSDNPFIIKK